MPVYDVAEPTREIKPKKKHVLLIANGDLRLSANQNCWAAQHEMEKTLADAFAAEGWQLVRAHPYKQDQKHGFIGSQKEGMCVFAGIDPKTPICVAEAVWQYSHHILHGLMTHKAPILTAANWSGTWPGLVGMLNLNGSLTKAGLKYTTIWSNDFTDKFFKKTIQKWLSDGHVKHKTPHVKALSKVRVPKKAKDTAKKLAKDLQQNKAIMGVFDEGCMGMFNAIIPDHLLNPTGVFKERMSQSAVLRSHAGDQQGSQRHLQLVHEERLHLPPGQERQEAPDQRAGALAVQDVRRGGSHR